MDTRIYPCPDHHCIAIAYHDTYNKCDKISVTISHTDDCTTDHDAIAHRVADAAIIAAGPNALDRNAGPDGRSSGSTGPASAEEVVKLAFDRGKQEAANKITAQTFHEVYERLAPNFGYETRKDSAVPWENVPEKNKKLMEAVCAEVRRLSMR